jgi:hypothetical protein
MTCSAENELSEEYSRQPVNWTSGVDMNKNSANYAKKTGPIAVSTETAADYSSLVSGISVRSINEIDHLIARPQ